MAAESRAGNGPQEPRAFWSGTITFGLVSVPVELYPAARPHREPLRTFGPDGQPLRRRYVCSADGRELTKDEIVRGYEWEDGSFTPVTDEELESLEPGKTRDIDLRRFVRRDRIPLPMLERTYVMAPGGESTKAYHLLAMTMERKNRAGIATFVMRGRQQLAEIFASGGLLYATTLRFASALRSSEDIGLPPVPRIDEGRRREFARALSSLQQRTRNRELPEDETAGRLRHIAEKKAAAGRDIVELPESASEDEEESPESAEIIDIMSILKRRMGVDGAGQRAASGNNAPANGKRKRVRRGETASARRRSRPSNEDLAALSKQALYEKARRLDVPGRSAMTKDELIAAVENAR